MKKATATYNAPKNDSEIVHMRGVRFIDGQATELNTDDHGRLIDKLKGNPHFDVEVSETEEKSEPKRKVGRPTNAEIEARQKEAPKKPEPDQQIIDKIES